MNVFPLQAVAFSLRRAATSNFICYNEKTQRMDEIHCGLNICYMLHYIRLGMDEILIKPFQK